MPTESNKIPCSGLRVALTICSLLYAIYDKNFKFKWVEIPPKIMESEFSWKLPHLPIWTSIPIEFYGIPCSGLRDVLTKKKQDWRTSQKHYALKFVVLGILQSQCTWKKLWLFPIRWIVRTCIIHWYHLEHHKPNQMYVKWIYIKIRHIVSQNQ